MKNSISKKRGAALLSLLFLVLFVLTIVCNTLLIPSRQLDPVPAAREVSLDSESVVMRLSGALRFKTVSHKDPAKFDYDEFLKLHAYLKTAFPEVHKRLKVETVNNYSLLYTWEGSDSSLKPIILTAHMDVVDVEKETLGMWSHAPFSGDVAEGRIWGRGARDNKGQMMAIIEAVDYLLKEDIQPKRTIILAFGHDEEVLGVNGAQKIAELLCSRGITPECVVDEGGTVLEKVIPGIREKTALIAIAEKGYLTLELSVAGESGHSSTPSEETTIGILCKSITRIENNKQPTTLQYAEPMLTYAASEMRFPYNLIFSNLWLTSGIVKQMMMADSDSAAMLRTTAAPTIIEGGFKDNVIPGTARATVNIRLLPGETIEGTIDRITKLIDDPRVKIEKAGYCNEAPAVSPIETAGFYSLAITIRQVYPDAVCVPYLQTGGTDAKHYAGLTPNLYRFTPSMKEKDETGHGINERIPIGNYLQYINFYVNLIQNYQNK